jgi:hypothetical protein
VLPKYFRHSRLQSFVRQLNFYNFKKDAKDRNEHWVYRQEYFQRDKPVSGVALHQIDYSLKTK